MSNPVPLMSTSRGPPHEGFFQFTLLSHLIEIRSDDVTFIFLNIHMFTLIAEIKKEIQLGFLTKIEFQSLDVERPVEQCAHTTFRSTALPILPGFAHSKVSLAFLRLSPHCTQTSLAKNAKVVVSRFVTIYCIIQMIINTNLQILQIFHIIILI